MSEKISFNFNKARILYKKKLDKSFGVFYPFLTIKNFIMETTINKSQKMIYKELELGYKNQTHRWARPEESQERADKLISLAKSVSHDSILDVGCGKGFLTNEFSKLGKVIGIDVSPSALREARKNNPNTRFYESSITDFSYNRHRFDLIIASECLNYIKNKQVAIKRMSALGDYLITSNFFLSRHGISMNGLFAEILLLLKLKPLHWSIDVTNWKIRFISLWKL